MKIAYFSPLNPQKSGISDYSEYLLEALMKYMDIDVWVDGFIPENQFIVDNFKIFDYAIDPEVILKLEEYDEIIYNIGNNPFYHSRIYDVFLRYNGVVILHEYVLYFLITGYILDYHHDGAMYLEELKMNHGDRGYAEGLKILRNSLPPLQYRTPELLPLNKRLIERAKGIIVHSLHAKSEVEKINPRVSCINIGQIGPDPKKINLSDARIYELKSKYGIEQSDVIIASFGYVSATKRIHQVLHALSEIEFNNYKYLLVGEGDYVKDLVKKYKLNDRVVFTGFTTIEEFDDLIALSDIIVNLRYPYMGETSASLIRALLLGKATVVSDIGWFSELPDDVVIKVPIEGREINVLKDSLTRLLNDSEYRNQVESNAKTYSEYLNPEVIANSINEYLYRLNAMKQREKFVFLISDQIGGLLGDLGYENHSEEYIKHVSIEIFNLLS